jgi:hypothetical protein
MATAQTTTVVGHRKQVVNGGGAVSALGHNPRQVQPIHRVGHDGALCGNGESRDTKRHKVTQSDTK